MGELGFYCGRREIWNGGRRGDWIGVRSISTNVHLKNRFVFLSSVQSKGLKALTRHGNELYPAPELLGAKANSRTKRESANWVWMPCYAKKY